MKTSFKWMLAGFALAVCIYPRPSCAEAADKSASAAGPFQPSWGSLAANYSCPDWFRDAKFGIMAHWSAQCVPEMGDWYERCMYMQGAHKDYDYHVARYGHPSKFGFKDIYPLWRAENWQPERLLALYKKAGAKYFMALAVHHDNFDNWNSKYQPWNSVNIGPKRDIIREWERAARHAGLRFAVSVHASRAWSWYEVAQGSDTNGPLAGVPYDGKLTKADGKGKWWEGLDPQDLYAQNHPPGKSFDWEWDAGKGSSLPGQAFIDNVCNRTIDLMDNYRPDMVFFDDSVLPFWPVSKRGLDLVAHYYNASVQRHGKTDVVLTGKILNEQQRRAIVWDLERGKSDRLEPFPWQTDTCLGNWHYKRDLYERHEYKTPATVIQMLVDIVSKNGNLMLSVPVRGDGSIDDDEVACLEAIGAWFRVNGEAIYGTRPWKVFGEGHREEKAGNFNESKFKGYTPDEIRFTTKGNTLYAFAMAWPADGRLVIRTLGASQTGIQGEIKAVKLVGSSARLKWTREAEGLVVFLPEKKPCDHVWAFKITGLNLSASQPVQFLADAEKP